MNKIRIDNLVAILKRRKLELAVGDIMAVIATLAREMAAGDPAAIFYCLMEFGIEDSKPKVSDTFQKSLCSVCGAFHPRIRNGNECVGRKTAHAELNFCNICGARCQGTFCGKYCQKIAIKAGRGKH
jgi:hypothetical protein